MNVDRSRRRSNRWVQFISLEARQLLAASFGGELWKVAGSDRADRIAISQDGEDPTLLQLRVNGEVVQRARIGKVRTIWIDGQAGNDRLDVQVPAQYAKLIKVRLDGAAGNDTLVGGSTVDELRGGDGADLLLGRDRNDLLDGGAGADDLSGDDGLDSLIGGTGNDKLAGGTGMDTLRGAGGDDSLAGGTDGDKLFGEKGSDHLDGGAGRDRLDGGSDVDAVRYTRNRDLVLGPIHERTSSSPAANLDRSATDLLGDAIDQSVELNRSLFGQETYTNSYWDRFRLTYGSVVLASGNLDSALSASGATARKFSQTNVQEAGVDEADVVETDGQYIYALSGDELVITDVRDPSNMSVVSRTSFEGSFAGIYLQPDGKLAVVSQVGGLYWYGWANTRAELLATDVYTGAQAPSTPQVIITTLDVTDRVAPVVSNVTRLDGSLQASRVIDGRLYVVLQNQIASEPVAVIEGTGGTASRYETEAEYRARLESLGSTILPEFTSTSGGRVKSGTIMSDATTFVTGTSSPRRIAIGFGANSYANIVGIDLGAPENGPFATTSVSSHWMQATYVSTDAIYLAGQDWSDSGQQTRITKFSLQGGAITLDATGSVAGWAQNSFNFDQQGDTLRVSYNHFADGGQVTAVAVLRDTGDTLEQVGLVDGLAPGESIFATRFIDDRVYLVTFQRIDPLFVVDLADPENPTVAGELKVPGFSTYLHPLADDLLLGVGQEADETGRMTGELKLSLFDVRDARNPRQVDVERIGGAGGWSGSEAEYGPHAFQYFADAGVIALPTYGEAGNVLSLYNVDRTEGLTRIGDIEPGFSMTTLRTVRIDDAVFAVSPFTIDSARLDDAGQLDSITIGESGIGSGDAAG